MAECPPVERVRAIGTPGRMAKAEREPTRAYYPWNIKCTGEMHAIATVDPRPVVSIISGRNEDHIERGMGITDRSRGRTS